MTSFCLALAGLLLCGVFALPGIICGHITLTRMKRSNSTKGKGLAIAALVIGYATLLFYLAFVVYLIFGALANPS